MQKTALNEEIPVQEWQEKVKHVIYRPSDRVRQKIENHAEIFGNIMRKKVTIMRNRCQIMRKFIKLIKFFPGLFDTYKIHVNVLPRI